jgi:dTDP-4-amino-4,6-dideoxygalactose transaminase
MGDVVCWSFSPGNNLGALGDAGAITTNRDDIADQVRLLRNCGSRIKYVNEARGFNSRLDSLQAAVLRVKLRHLEDWNARRRALACLYGEALGDTGLVLPRTTAWAEPVHHVYVIRSLLRNELQRHLNARGVATLIHYPLPPHLQNAYGDLGYRAGSLPITEKLHREMLSIPIGPHLSRYQVESVVNAIHDFYL